MVGHDYIHNILTSIAQCSLEYSLAFWKGHPKMTTDRGIQMQKSSDANKTITRPCTLLCTVKKSAILYVLCYDNHPWLSAVSITHTDMFCLRWIKSLHMFSVAHQQWYSHCGRSSQLDRKRCHGWGCWCHHHKAERWRIAPSLLLQTQTCTVEICRRGTNRPGREEAAAGTTAMAERLRMSLPGLLWAGDMRLQPGWHQVPSKDTTHLYVNIYMLILIIMLSLIFLYLDTYFVSGVFLTIYYFYHIKKQWYKSHNMDVDHTDSLVLKGYDEKCSFFKSANESTFWETSQTLFSKEYKSKDFSLISVGNNLRYLRDSSKTMATAVMVIINKWCSHDCIGTVLGCLLILIISQH